MLIGNEAQRRGTIMTIAEQLGTGGSLLWGAPMLGLLLGTGIFLTVRTRFLAWRNLGAALRLLTGPQARETSRSGISPLSALMTALASTIGTGNIVGVATALTAGGPGALVWMEISALFGLTTKFAECMLAVKFRRPGEASGGPMVVMARAIRPRAAGRALGGVFAFFTVLASFGIGDMTQSNSIATALSAAFGTPVHAAGLAVAALSLLVTLGGIRRISRVSSVLVPVMAGGYLLVGLAVIAGNWRRLPRALLAMLACALSPRAFAGGAAGAAVRYGVSRGVFSNEAGMGSAAITAAAAGGGRPAFHGYVNMTGTFFDTMIVCTITGLAICCSGVLGTPDPLTGRPLDGAALTIAAFETVLGPAAGALIALGIVLFAFSSILGWAYQGETALRYLTGGRAVPLYRLLFTLGAYAGAVGRLETVFSLSDLCNGLMALPNLVCLLLLSGTVAREMAAFQPELERQTPRRGRKRVQTL